MYTLVKTKSKYNKWQMVKNGRNIPPGQMQYKVKPNDIIAMLSTYISYNISNEEKNWNFCSHSSENLKKLTPNTYTGKSSNWKIILIIKRENNNGEVCYKGALQNKQTNEIALMTSINLKFCKNYKYRTVDSLHHDYMICQCKMIAPFIFWKELKNRLLY